MNIEAINDVLKLVTDASAYKQVELERKEVADRLAKLKSVMG
jgi:hypothetical protein